MDCHDKDLNYLSGLAKKYKEKTVNKKDVGSLLAVLLLLGGVTVYSTVNALVLQVSNYKLEKTLAQYTKPVQKQSPVINLPAPFLTKNVSFDFTKKLPELSIGELNKETSFCDAVELELPPTIKQWSKYKVNGYIDNAINFANNIYSF